MYLVNSVVCWNLFVCVVVFIIVWLWLSFVFICLLCVLLVVYGIALVSCLVYFGCLFCVCLALYLINRMVGVYYILRIYWFVQWLVFEFVGIVASDCEFVCCFAYFSLFIVIICCCFDGIWVSFGCGLLFVLFIWLARVCALLCVYWCLWELCYCV